MDGITPKQDATSHLRRIARLNLAESIYELNSVGLDAEAAHLKKAAEYIERAADWIASQPDS